MSRLDENHEETGRSRVSDLREEEMAKSKPTFQVKEPGTEDSTSWLDWIQWEC